MSTLQLQSETDFESRVAAVIAQWVKERVATEPTLRANLRVVFGTRRIQEKVCALLEGSSDVHRTFRVRASSDENAVLLRNGRDGVPLDRTLVYLVFWLPGEEAHDRNAQSLQDLRAVDVRDVLGDRSLWLEAERAIASQAREAAAPWPERQRARVEQLFEKVWGALRVALRCRGGGERRSVPFVRSVDAWLRYLDRARIPQGEWEALPAEARAATFFRRLGEALPELNLFRFSEIAHALRVPIEPPSKDESKAKSKMPANADPDAWVETIVDLLAENLEYAQDPTGLGERLAGKSTLEEQLDRLSKEVALCRNDSPPGAARAALERFCRDGDEAALNSVEWLYYAEPTNRRTKRLGLEGLLRARSARLERQTPLEAARLESEKALLTGASTPEEKNVVREYLDKTVKQGGGGFERLCELFTRLSNQEVPEGVEIPRKVLDELCKDGAIKPDAARRIANRWDRLRRSESKEQWVESRSVLFGLVDLVRRWLSERDGSADPIAADDQIEVRLTHVDGRQVGHDAPIEVRLTPANTATLTSQLGVFLRTSVSEAVARMGSQEGPEAADEEAGLGDALSADNGWTFFVHRVHGAAREPIGELDVCWSSRAADLRKRVRGDVLRRWELPAQSGATRPLARRVDHALESGARAVSFADPAIEQAWSKLMNAEGRDAPHEVCSLVAPCPGEARELVERWSRSVAEVARHAGAQDVSALQAELQTALARGDIAEAMRLNALVMAQGAAPSGGGSPTNDARLLLGVQSVRIDENDRPAHVLLSPYHPLVLRLRVLQDDLLGSVLRTLWIEGWPEASREDLSRAMTDWAFPEPLHAWSTWDGEPLVFDSWVDGDWALFSRLHARREHDAATIGVRAIADQVIEYSALHPAARTRLRLRIQGDREGRWAWSILRACREHAPDFAADVDLVTDLDEREHTAIDDAIVHEGTHVEAFELGSDGTPPAIRVRRVSADDRTGDRVHLTLLVGDLLEQLAPTWQPRRAEPAPPTPTPWSPGAFFVQALSLVQDDEPVVSDSGDELCANVSIAVGIASCSSGNVWVERQSTDPSRCAAPLARAQGNAHWLVLASRRPLFRAVQRAGSLVTALLDYRTVLERGRAVHVCVSLNAQRSASAIASMGAGLKEVLRSDARAIAPALVRYAQRIAPGLALQCVSSLGGSSMTGLLGLLLSTHFLRDQVEEGMLLPLDRHRDLLGRGQRADLLVVRAHGANALKLEIAESKASRRALDEYDGAIEEAQAQLEHTRTMLERFATAHPLAHWVRGILLRALAEQALADPESGPHWRELYDRALDPTTTIGCAPPDQNATLVWSLNEATQNADRRTGKSRVVIFGRQSTLDRLDALRSGTSA